MQSIELAKLGGGGGRYELVVALPGLCMKRCSGAGFHMQLCILCASSIVNTFLCVYA